jgi:hypothetical protein
MRTASAAFLSSQVIESSVELLQGNPIRAITLVWFDGSSHAFTCNLRSTQQATCTMSCLIDLYNSLTCAHKKEYYELHGNNNSYNGCGVVSWGSCFVHDLVVSRGNDLFLSPCSLSSTVTPGFKDKSECKNTCAPGSSYTHALTQWIPKHSVKA